MSKLLLSVIWNWKDLFQNFCLQFCECMCVCLSINLWYRNSDYTVYKVFIKFGNKVLLKRTCWPHTSFMKTGSMPITLYLSFKWISACTLNIYWPVWVKFGTTDLHILPLTKFEFCANLYSNSYILLQHKI